MLWYQNCDPALYLTPGGITLMVLAPVILFKRKPMEILQGVALGMKLRTLSDSARHRVWIVSPYIGRWPAVSSLLGADWWSSSVLLRVITDINGPHNVNQGTLIRLLERGPVRTLKGVHAKIYIVDDRAIVTSANLTETAFTKRREIGTLLEPTESKEVIAIVSSWWDNYATEISLDSVKTWQAIPAYTPEEEGAGLPKLWSLPQKPSDDLFSSSGKNAQGFADYRKFLNDYSELARQYVALQRLWPETPLFLETDAFLNYLFHEAEGTPSFVFRENSNPRTLTNDERAEELGSWAPKFAQWVRDSQEQDYRVKYSRLIRKLLGKDWVDDLSLDEVRQVLDCLHCMRTYPPNMKKFLNPINNDLETIRSAWKDLIHGGDKPEQRMQRCNASLRFFGTSSVQELLGWYYPDEFPIRNGNSDAGLRFWGYGA